MRLKSVNAYMLLFLCDVNSNWYGTSGRSAAAVRHQQFDDGQRRFSLSSRHLSGLMSHQGNRHADITYQEALITADVTDRGAGISINGEQSCSESPNRNKQAFVSAKNTTAFLTFESEKHRSNTSNFKGLISWKAHIE